MKEPRVAVKIGPNRVSLPLYGENPGDCEAIAREVEEKLAAVENEGGPINTTAFALRVACDYAAALRALQAERARELDEMSDALHALQTRLLRLTDG